jgi:hypothetical protein
MTAGYAGTVQSLRQTILGCLPEHLKLAFSPVPTHPSQAPPAPPQAAPPMDPAAMAQQGPPMDPAAAAAAGGAPPPQDPVSAGAAQGVHPELLAIVETLTSKMEAAGQEIGTLKKEVSEMRALKDSRENVARETFRPGE